VKRIIRVLLASVSVSPWLHLAAQPVHGINSIQLFTDGTRWWVVGMLWDNERPDKPIPPEFTAQRR
jgi:hypothetical protein